ncbi:MAG: ABC transporter permease [Pseudomonadota bacterium]|nr:ABC transporter permease [Pseudomonadota bacterium]
MNFSRSLYRVGRVCLLVSITMIGLLFVTFVIGRIMPIDPVLAIVGDHASEETYLAVRNKMGLDRPLHSQLGLYFWQILRGDLGVSSFTQNPVSQDLLRYFPATFELATIATLLGVLFGVPMGVLGAVYKDSLIDHIVRVVSLLGYSMPTFWLGMIGLMFLYAQLGWVGGPGRLDIFYHGVVPTVTGMILIDSLIVGDVEVLLNACSHIVLPASILGYFSTAYITRMTRAFMIDQLGQEYILAGRSRGLREGRLIWKHALGNALVPLITVIALSYGSLLEGSVLTETVFAWPGLGLYLTNALLSADMNAVLGATMVVGVIFLFLNLVTDLLYSKIDPRIN